MPTAPARTHDGFAWTANPDGTHTIHDVPLFCTCSRGPDVYDEAWVRAAFARLRQADAEGHLPPVTLHHDRPHRPPPKAVGFFRATRIGPLPWRGVSRPWIFADLVITDPAAFQAVAAKRIPYRSVDVDRTAGEVVSLALLDYEPPYLEGPMTFLRGGDAVTIPPPQIERALAEQAPVVAFARWSDGRDTILMEAAMPQDEKKPDAKSEEKPDEKGKPEGEKKPMGEDGGGKKGGGADSALALVERLAGTKVPLEDAAKVVEGLEALLARLRGGGGATPAAPAKPSDDLAEPKPMSKDPKDQAAFDRLQAQVLEARADAQAAKAGVAAIQQDRAVDTAVRGALAELEQFAHVETAETLRQVCADFGGVEGLQKYVARLKAQLPQNLSPLTTSFAKASAGTGPALPPEVAALKLSNPAEGEMALKAFRLYEPLAKAGHVTVPFDRYFAHNRDLLESLTR